MGEAVVTSEKQKNEETGDKKPKKSKKRYYKMIIRRIPAEMTEEELLKVLGPLPSHERFWFRSPEKFLEDDGLPYAFLVLDDFEEALKFQRKFHGQVLTDFEGKESRITVEKSPNQDFNKNPSTAKSKNKPISEDVGYIKFLEEAENNTGKKVDFDVLVNEIVERERKIAQGICQETPLTDFFIRQAHSALKSRKGKGPGKDTSDNSKKSKGKPKNPKESSSRKEFDQKKERVDRKKEEFDQKKKETPSGSQMKDKKERFSSKPKKEFSERPQKENPIQQDKPQRVEKQHSTENQKLTESKREGNSGGSQEQKSDKKFQRNKDRPERALYQPGRGRRVFNKSVNSSTKSSEEKPKPEEKSNPPQQ